MKAKSKFMNLDQLIYAEIRHQHPSSVYEYRPFRRNKIFFGLFNEIQEAGIYFNGFDCSYLYKEPLPEEYFMDVSKDIVYAKASVILYFADGQHYEESFSNDLDATRMYEDIREKTKNNLTIKLNEQGTYSSISRQS